MNNKGFAITGIIYTLFVMFLMILLSVLSGLSSLQRLMINSNENLEDAFKGVTVIQEEILEMNKPNNRKAKYFGKYIFEVTGPNSTTIQCSTYLEKGTNFQDESITYSPSDCNKYIYEYGTDISLKTVYSFEKEN